MRVKITLAQRLPADMEEKIVEFHRFVLRARRRHDYQLSHILNMAETPMRFELPATRTLEFTGNRTVPILSCGGDKHSFTVVLAVKANGEKLPPKVIFLFFVFFLFLQKNGGLKPPPAPPSAGSRWSDVSVAAPKQMHKQAF